MVRDLNIDNLHVYDKAEDAMNADLVIMTVVGDADLEAATEVVKSIPKDRWQGKTLVQYSSHEPLSIKDHEKLLALYGVSLVGGAMFAVPETVCSDEGVYFVGASEQSTIDKVSPLLEELGPIIPFVGDVGLASLADIVLLLSLFFGAVGMELGYYLMEIYDGADDVFKKKVVADMTPMILPTYWLYLSRGISEAIQSDNFDGLAENGNDANSMVLGLEMYLHYMKKVGLTDDLFLTSYMNHMRRVPGKHGFSEVVKFYKKEPKMPTADL